MPKDLPSQKNDARKAAAESRAAEYSHVAEALANLRLTRFIESIPESSMISGYLPIGSELSPLHTMCVAHQIGHTICVPVVVGDSQPLKFRTWSPESKLKKGRFGVKTPVDGAWVEPEYLIVPLLAFDERNYRLGYGGGYYDRTIAAIRKSQASETMMTIGIAFDAQQFASMPVGPFDQRLDLVITERRVIK